MLRTIEQKNNFVDDLWKNYTNELDKELQSKCLELFGNYNDFCIFGINVGNNSGIYLIPFEHSTLALLRDEAGAFWGVSYSGGKSFEIRESQKNDIDRFILEKTGLPFFKFRSSDDKTFSELNEKLALYLRVKLKRKKSIFSHEVSLDELLSRFNDALALGDANTAGVYLQHIEKRSEIFLINKIFLAIKYYYLLKDWGSIVNHKDLLDLKDIRRPRLITEYILMAIYNTRIRPVISNSDEAIQVFNEQVAPLFSSLMLYSDDYKAKEV